jgi:ribonuclease HII
MIPTVLEELALRAAGYQQIAGVDEVGRGCWAGPVVAAAVVLHPEVIANPALLAGVQDSKTLSAQQRTALYDRILDASSGWAVGIVPPYVIDGYGILEATRLAMQVAILKLPCPPDALLIDAVQLHGWPCMQRSLIKGDARCLSIAAASIIAKVTRDRMMAALDTLSPCYGFAQHKGYGTALHQHALHVHGPSMYHRRTFRPITALLEQRAEHMLLSPGSVQ